MDTGLQISPTDFGMRVIERVPSVMQKVVL